MNLHYSDSMLEVHLLLVLPPSETLVWEPVIVNA